MQKTIIVKANQNIIYPLLWIGSETEMELTIKLIGHGANIKFVGLLLGRENETLQMKLRVIHQAPKTTSNIIIKSAIADKARIDIDGLVNVEKGAKGTDAWLGAHMLLLSEKAHGRATPSLEILENDIKGGHAATVGKINEIELFYLMSRGLTRQNAKKLLVEGFLSSMLADFPQTKTKQAVKVLEQFT